jgi:hypothetical protein
MRVQLGVTLAFGLVVASCGPELLDSGFCAALYDAPDSFPECAPSTFCGDARCDRSQETYASCPADCPPPLCGDGICDDLEDLSCPDCEGLRVCCCCEDDCRTTHPAACECTFAAASFCHD